jgi:hypothetical protein
VTAVGVAGERRAFAGRPCVEFRVPEWLVRIRSLAEAHERFERIAAARVEDREVSSAAQESP